MKNYFTTLQVSNNTYIGEVYDKTNNQLLYTTKPYLTQRQAVQEMDFFIDGTVTNDVVTINKPEVPVQSTLPPKTAPRRCCGR